MNKNNYQTVRLEKGEMHVYDFGCWDEGEYLGAVGKDTIKRMRKSN